MEKMRLNKYLASCGVCSRREADKLIDNKCVYINGHLAQMGEQVSDEDEITVNGNRVSSINIEKVVYAYYKPRGVTTTERDPHAEFTLEDILRKIPERVTYAGRLDKESEGLLLLTNDGELIDGLMRGRFEHEKEYEVTVDKVVTAEFLEKLSGGVFLKELEVKTRPCKVEKIGKKSFRITLTQGLNRQIRRMCEAFSYEVCYLKRVRVANIELAKMKIGEYRKIEGIELQMLYKEIANNGDSAQ